MRENAERQTVRRAGACAFFRMDSLSRLAGMAEVEYSPLSLDGEITRMVIPSQRQRICASGHS